MKRRTTTLTAAERAEARYNLLTTGQVAERLSDENIDGDTVRSWIEHPDPDRRLHAVDGRKSGATRPYWLIEWSWVEDFLERRSSLRSDAA